MQLQTNCPGPDLFAQGFGHARIAFAEQADIDGQRFNCLKHAVDRPGAGGNGGGQCSHSGTGTTTHQSGGAAGQRLLCLLRAMK